jgi:UPF0755 protein
MRRPEVMVRRALLAILVLAVIAAAVVGGWLHHSLWGARSVRAVSLEISAGSSARDILMQLHSEGLMPSVLAGRIYLRVAESGRTLHFGHYHFPPSSRPVDVLDTIIQGAVEMFTVTVVEGSEAADIGAQFTAMGVGAIDDWERFVTDVRWLGRLVPDAPSLEGFFFPDTYRFAVGISAERVARHLVERFEKVWEEETRGSGELWGSTLEIVTLASMVEAETSIEDERRLIAGVFANRLRRGMLLQCDPTVAYSLKRRGEWKGRLLRVHWEIDDPYNTYRYHGLPPGPINSPGRAALAAAIYPATTPHLYFVARPSGGHAFSKTLSEHNRAVAQLLSSRR